MPSKASLARYLAILIYGLTRLLPSSARMNPGCSDPLVSARFPIFCSRAVGSKHLEYNISTSDIVSPQGIQP
ncbi:hypothetical protein K432DRAFT_379174 [Lepidopterella palustris CBS 459.81]|uniref:Secreted protein n=1 Tax=Lepidopterella palustris CBS 459.81 TaxID=1314670 RepID=A0A8E2EGW7_9PEZI|nr:hypothetical protein K432DRAFT_379174 [Lepidopterella palustris CBS 459.81]